jgi:hypothetical protein
VANISPSLEKSIDFIVSSWALIQYIKGWLGSTKSQILRIPSLSPDNNRLQSGDSLIAWITELCPCKGLDSG